MKKPTGRIQALFITLILLALTGLVTAQEQEITEALALSNRPVVIEIFAAPGAPTIEPLADGRVVFKISDEGPVSGDLEGTIRQSITQTQGVTIHMEAMSAMFTIETDQGTLEGYYVGTIHPEGARLMGEGAETVIGMGHGQILSVSGAYADLFLADVYLTGELRFSHGRATSSSSTMTITARR
jgi:hypothetical protein